MSGLFGLFTTSAPTTSGGTTTTVVRTNSSSGVEPRSLDAAASQPPSLFDQKPIHLDKVAPFSAKSHHPVNTTVSGRRVESLKRTGEGVAKDVELVLTLCEVTHAELAEAIGYKYNEVFGARDVQSFVSGRCKELERRTNLFYSTYFADEGAAGLVAVPKPTQRFEHHSEYSSKLHEEIHGGGGHRIDGRVGGDVASAGNAVATQNTPSGSHTHLSTKISSGAATISGKVSSLARTGKGLAADVDAVLAHGILHADLAKAIGYKYSRSNGPRDVQSFVSGRCKDLARRTSIFYETYFASPSSTCANQVAGKKASDFPDPVPVAVFPSSTTNHRRGGSLVVAGSSPAAKSTTSTTKTAAAAATASVTTSGDSKLCAICFALEKNICLVPCGHQCCDKCSPSLKNCHLCRANILQKIVLH